MPAAATFAIPCRNAGPHLRPLLASLLAQTNQDFDLLLVDDASTDGSVEVARELAGDRIRIEQNAAPRGLAGNFARCAELAATPHLCLAHQDDVYEPTYLATLLAALAAAPDAAFAHCPARAIDDRGAPVDTAAERHKLRRCARAAAAGDDRRALYALLFAGNFVCCPSVLFRTEILRAAGGFDASLQFALDWELWFRLLRRGHTFATVPTPLVRYRRHQAAASHGHTRDLSRFREELAVLATAREGGIAARLLADGARSHAVRNNVLHEALEDLRRGDAPAARAKVALLRAEPAHARDPWLRAFAGLAMLGPPGRAALGVGRALAVRLGLGDAG